MLSHELRNPLAPLRNSTYILRHAAPGSEQTRRAQAVIERQIDHLTRLVDELLDVTRIARGKIALHRERIDLREVVRRAADDFRLLLDERGVPLRTALPESKVAELHGGSVHAASAGIGKGAEFVVRLPLASASPGAEPVRPVPSAGTVRRRVLVVDDNRDAAESLADILAMLGHAVEVAYDGASAVAKVRASAPDLVLCDIGLPGMSGLEVARALREAGTAAQLFAVSGYAQPEDATRAIEAGFDGYLAKPVDPEQIERLLS